MAVQKFIVFWLIIHLRFKLILVTPFSTLIYEQAGPLNVWTEETAEGLYSNFLMHSAAQKQTGKCAVMSLLTSHVWPKKRRSIQQMTIDLTNDMEWLKGLDSGWITLQECVCVCARARHGGMGGGMFDFPLTGLTDDAAEKLLFSWRGSFCLSHPGPRRDAEFQLWAETLNHKLHLKTIPCIRLCITDSVVEC